MNKIKTILFLIVIFLCVACNKTKQKLELQPLFSNNMVLQQDQTIPVWGMAGARCIVSVSFRKQLIETVADEDGKWIIKLQPEIAGTGDSLIITTQKEQIVFKNVAVGEVWLASGQSNMEVALINTWAPVNNAEAELSTAHYPDIRFLLVNRNTTIRPVNYINSDGWITCSPETAGDFSAVAYFFARNVYNNIKVPVGIIQSAWGGTVAQAWISKESLELLEEFAGEIKEIESLPDLLEEQKKIFDNANLVMLNEMAIADDGISNNDTLFKSANYDHSRWDSIHLPSKWEESFLGEFDGSVWFRKDIVIPKRFEGTEMILNLPPVDDIDEVWLNGVKIGNSIKWAAAHHYTIPAALVKTGINNITLRVTDTEGNGGFSENDADFFISSNSDYKINLSGYWKIHKGYDLKDIVTKPLGPFEPNRVTTLFNAMINPLIPYSIRGVIWYQGESNTNNPKQYSKLFPTLINDWRTQWKVGDFPFYFVQLPNYMKRNTIPTTDNWAELREAQWETLQLANTGMAVTIDLGDSINIHPGNKQDVGLRLALLALNKTYQFEIPFSGPLFKSAEVNSNKITIDFWHTYDGLQTSDGKEIRGFAIAGDDGIFYWAQAKIVNNKVILTSSRVKKPKILRYAWSANPDCNLTNSEGLPAAPFKTDL